MLYSVPRDNVVILDVSEGFSWQPEVKLGDRYRRTALGAETLPSVVPML